MQRNRRGVGGAAEVAVDCDVLQRRSVEMIARNPTGSGYTSRIWTASNISSQS